MKDYIKKKKKKAKKYGICLGIGFIAMICLICFTATMSYIYKNMGFLIMTTIIYSLSWWISLGVYLDSMLNFMLCLKWLKKHKLEDVADDISLDRPISPKSKVYCGQRALFCKKSMCIIPYSEIGWTYIYKRSVNGITVEKSTVFRTKEGKKLKLFINPAELDFLLRNYIIKQAPDIIIGYDAEKRALYEQMYPQCLKPRKRAMTIGGIILICCGLVMATIMIINIEKARIIPCLAFIFGFFGAGVGLYLFGQKK